MRDKPHASFARPAIRSLDCGDRELRIARPRSRRGPRECLKEEHRKHLNRKEDLVVAVKGDRRYRVTTL